MSHPHGISASSTSGNAARAGSDGLEDARVVDWTESMLRGDRSAYESLFRARCSFVEREAVRRLGTRRDFADDVAQEVWMRVARRPIALRGVAALDAWLRQVVCSTAIDLLRSELARRVRESAVARERNEAVRFLADYELLEELRCEIDGLDSLSPDERALFELKARTDATTARLAGWIGLGPAAVDSKLRRAAERARAARGEA